MTIIQRLKRRLQRIPVVRRWVRKGYFVKRVRRQRGVNFLCQRILGINSEARFSVHFTSRVVAPRNIVLGEGVEHSFMWSGGCYIQAVNGIRIGDHTVFAPGVKIISANHNIFKIGDMQPARPVSIGKRCWIGANAVILPGVVLGDDTIVGAGTVVSRSYPQGNIIIVSNRDNRSERISSLRSAGRRPDGSGPEEGGAFFD